MKAAEIFELFHNCIRDYHKTDDVDAALNNPYTGGLEELLYRKNWIDTVQWHLEDIVRDPEIDAQEALQIKRRIDSSNQDRTDIVEQIDDIYMARFSSIPAKADAKLNTESLGWAIDRLSILALKQYHMEIEANRPDAESGQKHKSQIKLTVLLEQGEDLCLAIDQLIADIESGERICKVYRQMKMYNDPSLNPVLYKNQR